MPNLTSHVRKLLKTQAGRESLHQRFKHFREQKISQEITQILTDQFKISEALLNLNSRLEEENIDLGAGLTKFIGEPVVLKDELTVTQFFELLDHNRPIFDEGVSPVHGKYTHAIQQYILQYHLGKERMEEVFDLIRSSPAQDCQHTRGRKWTLWDEYFDRPAPYEIENKERNCTGGAVASGHRSRIPQPPCLDGRSPEWLTTVIALSPNHGIDHIFHSVTSDLKARADNIHENIFVTGLESPEYLNLLAQAQN